MAKKYKLKKYPGGGEKKKEITSVKPKPTFDSNLWNPNKYSYSKGFEPDPVKWNKFAMYLREEKVNGKPAAGNTDLDNKDTKHSQQLIDNWNKLHPDSPISQDDIQYAQDWAIRQNRPINEGQKDNTKPAKPDLWLGSKTSQIYFPVTASKYGKYGTEKDPSKKLYTDQTVPLKTMVGELPYTQQLNYNKAGSTTILPGMTKGYDETFKLKLPEQQYYQQPEQVDTINMVQPLDPNKLKQIKTKDVTSPLGAYGGQFQQFPEGGVKDFFHNFGTGIADIGLSVVGAGDVINEGDYRGKNAKGWTQGTDVAGKIVSTAAPLVAGAIGGPGAAMAVSAGQKAIGGNLNKQFGQQDPNPQMDQFGNILNTLAPIAGNFIGQPNSGQAMAQGAYGGQFRNNTDRILTEPTKAFPNGGEKAKQRIAEIERDRAIQKEQEKEIQIDPNQLNEVKRLLTIDEEFRQKLDGKYWAPSQGATVDKLLTGDKTALDIADPDGRYRNFLLFENQKTLSNQQVPLPGQNIPMMPFGGQMMQPNAELEKQEVMQMPNGTTEQVNGPSHAQGGVDVNIPNGTRIFSDRLKSSNKKTFAKEAEKFKTDKEEKILKDVKADKLKKATAELMLAAKNKNLDKLFQEQESLKMSKVQKYAEKHGIQMPMMTNGGQYKYEDGGRHEWDNTRTGQGINFWDPSLDTRVPQQFGTQGYNPMASGQGPYTDATHEVGTNFNLTPEGQRVATEGSGNKFDFGMNNQTKDALGYGAGAIAQNLGNLAYLGQQGKKYDTQQEYQYNPSLLSDKEALRQADTEGRVAAQNIASASGGNAGSYLSNRVALGSGLTKAKAGIMEDFANKNAQIKNQGQQFNIQNKYMVDDVNAQNKGRAQTNYYTALNSVGQGAAGAYKDYNTTQMERQKIGMLPQIYDVYKNNPELAKLIMSWSK